MQWLALAFRSILFPEFYLHVHNFPLSFFVSLLLVVLASPLSPFYLSSLRPYLVFNRLLSFSSKLHIQLVHLCTFAWFHKRISFFSGKHFFLVKSVLIVTEFWSVYKNVNSEFILPSHSYVDESYFFINSMPFCDL